MYGFFFANRDAEPFADVQNDPVSPQARRMWTESDRLIAAQDREARREAIRGDLRAIGIGTFLALLVVGLIAWSQS